MVKQTRARIKIKVVFDVLSTAAGNMLKGNVWQNLVAVPGEGDH